MGEGEDVVKDQPLTPREQPGDYTDMDLNTETEPPVDPGVPRKGLFDPVYAFCSVSCVSSLARVQYSTMNQRLQEPQIH